MASLGALALPSLAACGVTRGDDAGSTRLRMMIPNSPGGGYDLTGRAAVRVMEDTGITSRFEVFNVIGAGGTVAMARLANERGNEDLMMAMGLGVVGATFTNKSQARVSGMTPLARLIRESEGVIVPADSPHKDIKSLIDAWKKDPKAVSIGGGSSPGGPDHLFPMEFAKAVDIDPREVNYITYDGGGDLLPALLGSKIKAGMSGLGEYAEQIKKGQVKVLATSGEERVPGIDAPTLKESDVDLTFINWRGVLAPPGIPSERRDQLIGLLQQMHGSRAWKDALKLNNWTDARMTGDEFGDFLTSQDERVETTLKELGLL
ncbi:tripartite tricarboxylate transporter substrate-binding protein [Janibacter limosus]|uniref:Tripartite tricarboxylate transporter substrate binding protein n=2 Tax=Janibacter limosus TaxID=53458 RepID=A0AC61U918_9MICO|nr:tripartite tricarboxylate transporter substrate-binding protein [Janibacter limosus]UUZ46347.1 tripartite tricarboxylate transporter substrate-binding protein [Janibacter limosus]